jgi:hypothetical protein
LPNPALTILSAVYLNTPPTARNHVCARRDTNLLSLKNAYGKIIDYKISKTVYKMRRSKSFRIAPTNVYMQQILTYRSVRVNTHIN